MNYSKRMAPNHFYLGNALPLEPVSRTYQYRKIMKPMLERKRRARINKCLDELKDLMTGTLQANGENVSKLEKADILELTVRHLHRLREHNALFVRSKDTANMEKFWAGFQHCAAEVSQFLGKYDRSISGDLIKHIASHLPNMVAVAAATTPAAAANYQRFCTAVQQLQSSSATSKVSGEETNKCLKPALGATEIYETAGASATANMRLHPYARAVEVGDGVWRPW